MPPPIIAGTNYPCSLSIFVEKKHLKLTFVFPQFFAIFPPSAIGDNNKIYFYAANLSIATPPPPHLFLLLHPLKENRFHS